MSQLSDMPSPSQLAEVYRAAVSDNDRETANAIREAAVKLAAAESAVAEARALTQFALRIQP
jgi:hypothetical protein